MLDEQTTNNWFQCGNRLRVPHQAEVRRLLPATPEAKGVLQERAEPTLGRAPRNKHAILAQTMGDDVLGDRQNRIGHVAV